MPVNYNRKSVPPATIKEFAEFIKEEYIGEMDAPPFTPYKEGPVTLPGKEGSRESELPTTRVKVAGIENIEGLEGFDAVSYTLTVEYDKEPTTNEKHVMYIISGVGSDGKKLEKDEIDTLNAESEKEEEFMDRINDSLNS